MKITTSDLLAALEEYGRERPKRPQGKGWMTTTAVAAQRHVTLGAVKLQIQKAIQNGVSIERFVGSDYGTDGRLVKQTWYRVKP